MKNKQGNKHLKKHPYFTLRESLKDYYYAILVRIEPDKSFQYIVCDEKDSIEHIEDAGIINGCIFRSEKDADTFLDKLIRNNGFTSKEEFKKEKENYRVMSIEEMFSEYRIQNEEREYERHN